MSRESEKALKGIWEFLEQNGKDDMSMEDMNALVAQYMDHYNANLPGPVTEKTAKTSDDFMELAESAADEGDDSSAVRFARKALKLDPDNLDAERILAQLGSTSLEDHLKKLERAIRRGEEVMEKHGLKDDDSIGKYWGILETRPYMRLRHAYMTDLCDFGMHKKAMGECEELCRLSENDNLGVRFQLMHLYALYDEEEKALELTNRYDGETSTQFLMSLAILYFRRGDLATAEKYLKQLMKVNKDTGKFFKGAAQGELEKYSDSMSSIGYRPFTIEELIVDLYEGQFLYIATPGFVSWAYDKTRRKKRT